MTDAIHNFHPQYQQYTQYSSAARHNTDDGTASASTDKEKRSVIGITYYLPYLLFVFLVFDPQHNRLVHLVGRHQGRSCVTSCLTA